MSCYSPGTSHLWLGRFSHPGDQARPVNFQTLTIITIQLMRGISRVKYLFSRSHKEILELEAQEKYLVLQFFS